MHEAFHGTPDGEKADAEGSAFPDFGVREGVWPLAS